MPDPPVSNKLKRFEVGRTIPVGRLNALVNDANRPPQMGAGGLQRITSPGGGDMYNVPYRSEVLFAELNDQFEDGSRLRKGAGLLVDDGTGQSTEFVKLDHEYEPVMSCGVPDVHLVGEQQFLSYNHAARHWLPMRGIQGHQGRVTETNGILGYATGSVEIYRDGDHLDAADGATTIIVQAIDWAGLGANKNDHVLVFQTLHDRKWYFMHSLWYAGADIGGPTITVGTSPTAVAWTRSVMDFSKTGKVFEFNGASTAIHGDTGGAGITYQNEKVNGLIVVHVSAYLTLQADDWCLVRVELEQSVNSGSSWAGFDGPVICQMMLGSSLEDDVDAIDGGSVTVATNERSNCCSLHGQVLIDPETAVRQFRLAATKIANTGAVVSGVTDNGGMRCHAAYPAEPQNTAF